MRLDNLVSKALFISRTEAKSLIAKSKIYVNQQIEKNKNKKLSPLDKVTYKNELLTLPGTRYYMLNKPAGFICSSAVESKPSAISLLQGQHLEGLHFAGRLDADTTGLVLISDDGQWTHRITSPKHQCAKVYLVDLAEDINSTQVKAITNGVLLKDTNKPTLPSELEKLDSNTVRLTIFEGRYHQVKRMFAAVGNHVVNLHRESIGGLALDSDLALGSWRELTEQEVGLF